MTGHQHIQTPLRTRIFEILSGDSQFSGMVGTRINSNSPDNSAYPRVKIGGVDDVYNDWGGHNFDGFQGSTGVRAWSQAESDLEVMRILDRAYALLHLVDLEIPGFPTISFRCTLNQVLLEPDGRTYQGIQRYRFIFGGSL